MAAAKPKIDLKARLGKKASPQTAVGGPSVPPPSGAGPSHVAPSGHAAAPAGFGPSIPPPPGFGPKPPAARPSPSMAPVHAAPSMPPRQQAIKIEMSEEVVEAQKRGRSKVMVLAAICAGIGVAAGFGVGQMAKGAEGAEAAVAGAESLVKEIDETNIKLQELGEILKKAGSKVRENKFPSEEIEALGALDIPFSGTNLLNKGIGRFNATATTMLMQYANGAQSANDQKDKIRRLFSAVKPQFEAAAAEQESPMVKWGVAVTSGPKGPWAQVKMIKPFEVNDKKAKNYRWPDEVEAGKTKAALYTKGEPKTDGSEIFPVDPASQLQVCPETVHYKLMGALSEFSQELTGDDTPGSEQLGLIELGDKTMDQLRKIGGSR